MPFVSSQGLPLGLCDRTLFVPGPLRDSGHLLGRPERARERPAAEGCLYLRGVLDRTEVLRLREAYFAVCDPVLLAPGTTPREGVFSGRVPPGLPPHGVPGHPAYAFVRSETFRRFLASPALTAVADALLGGPSVMLPRRVLRHFHRGARAARALGRRRLWADYAAGDVTAHLPHIVRASLDNRTPAMRLSVDVRFVRRGDRADPRRLRDWSGDDGF
ncbi:phytanoyl-CoA dioxygenase [Streptosporangium nondiastaticum]|uniref:Phytanoyl-CoA dioxygenase n=1 Tax=Streptosporangium nondiastaticum TaxID=35764 RepID=A0A9X7JJY2_9ACTN|nr:phytanoyl-CoA dioxygenase [Streptosporangium nondiastaticum]PSJ25144.1 phytanoyl-CoA dioxygenase [Streptosporangium nondiastaticum]